MDVVGDKLQYTLMTRRINYISLAIRKIRREYRVKGISFKNKFALMSRESDLLIEANDIFKQQDLLYRRLIANDGLPLCKVDLSGYSSK